MQLHQMVQIEAQNKGIKGVVHLAKECDLSYEKTVRVWKGLPNAKVCDVVTVLDYLGMEIKYVKKGN